MPDQSTPVKGICPDCGTSIDSRGRSKRCKPCRAKAHSAILAKERERQPGPNPSGLCWCGCGQPTPLAIRTKALDHTVMGKPIRYIKGHYVQPAAVRFWAKVEKGAGPDDCWEWQGSKVSYNYGSFRDAGVLHYAHRYSFEMAYGPIPDGLKVLHDCDNPPCVRPDHLFLGTQQENVIDMFKKGRGVRLHGVQHPKAKFVDDEICDIRRRSEQGETVSALARSFGVAPQTIGHIVHRKTWKHIE